MSKIKTWYLRLNIFYRLLPFLLLYVIICVLLSENKLVYDEQRYMAFAKNLLAGFYSPPYPNYNLWNGPGYPLLMVPFVFLKLPLIWIKILNAIFLYVSLILSFKTFTFYASKKASFLFTALLGLYFPIYEQIPYIYTECLTWFLITLVCYLFLKNYQQKNISWGIIFAAALSISCLAMTKIIFGYVIEVMVFVSLFALFLPQTRSTAKKSALIFLLSFIFCLPWLFYTHHVSRQSFYWGNSGSMSLYTMSSPYPNELGDWMTIPDLSESPNHKVFMDSISKLNSLQKDEAYRAVAISNIRQHPGKYFFNWMNNIGRLLFSFPFSNAPQAVTNYFTIVPNMLIVFFILFSIIISILNYKKIPQDIILIMVFVFVYVFGSSLVSGYRRMFYVTMPIWFFFILYVLNNFVTVQIKRNQKKFIEKNFNES